MDPDLVSHLCDEGRKEEGRRKENIADGGTALGKSQLGLCGGKEGEFKTLPLEESFVGFLHQWYMVCGWE